MWDFQEMLDSKDSKVLQESKDLQDREEIPDLLDRVDFLANQGHPVLRAKTETQALLVQQDVMEMQVTEVYIHTLHYDTQSNLIKSFGAYL